MPKVSEEHKERRRASILEGARRAFARHGYEGATVARIEEETGLSRGAIFNYYENKEALFVALVQQSSDRFVDLWLAEGFRSLVEAIAHEDPDWLSVLVEGAARIRTDEGFRAQMDRLEATVRTQAPAREERLRAWVREDVPIKDVARFLALVANGLALARVTGEPVPDLDGLMTLVETGVAPGLRSE